MELITENCDHRPGWGPEHLARKARLRDPHTYTTAGEWWGDYRGFVPIQMAHGLSQVMKRRGVTFPEAWDILVGTGQIVMLDDAPGEATDPEATAAANESDAHEVRRTARSRLPSAPTRTGQGRPPTGRRAR
jgi:hypothetical protein